MIGDRLFSVLDENETGHIELKDFIQNMLILFGGSFLELSKLIFKMYDFDGNGLISKEAVRTVLSYVPISSGYMDKRLKLEK